MSLLVLPNELICSLFDYADTPLDYYRLCMIHPLLYTIGSSFSSRYSFLYRTLIDDGRPMNDPKRLEHKLSTNHQKLNAHVYTQSPPTLSQHQQPDQYRSTLCRFLASSPIPLSSVYTHVLLELVPTSHFCHFTDYTDTNIKKLLLQVFSQTRHHHRTITPSRTGALTIPTLVNKTFVATAQTCSRHRVIDGAPRRVYYNVTLHNDMPKTTDDLPREIVDHSMPALLTTAMPPPSPLAPPTSLLASSRPSVGDTLFALIHDTDTVVGFDQDLNCHHGRLWYEDEGILTDSSWSTLLDVDRPPPDDGAEQPAEFCDLRPAMPAGYTDYYKTYHYRGWRPCLLQTLYNCTLKQNVRKGGLKQGDRFDCVFVYEHREDDTICLEFCQRDEQRQRWVPQGFLLFAEHHIVWSS